MSSSSPASSSSSGPGLRVPPMVAPMGIGVASLARDLRAGTMDTRITTAESEAAEAFELKLEDLLSRMEAELSVYEYDGFDPSTYRKILLTHIRKKVDSPAAVQKVISQAILLISQRGVKVDIDRRVKEEAKTALREMIRVGFNLNPPARAQPMNVITLQRVGACFPFELSVVYAAGKGRIVGERPFMLPKFMCHPHSLSLLPREMTKETAVEQWTVLNAWRYNFTVTVTNGTQTQAQMMENIAKFGSIIFNSTLYSREERVEKCGALAEIEMGNSRNFVDRASIILFFAQMDPILRRLKRGDRPTTEAMIEGGLSQATIAALGEAVVLLTGVYGR